VSCRASGPPDLGRAGLGVPLVAHPVRQRGHAGEAGQIERAEEAVRRLGFRVCRVRHHDTVARLEIGRDEMARALDPEVAAALVRDVKAAGYQFVALDLLGYRLGSLNEPLKLTPV